MIYVVYIEWVDFGSGDTHRQNILVFGDKSSAEAFCNKANIYKQLNYINIDSSYSEVLNQKTKNVIEVICQHVGSKDTFYFEFEEIQSLLNI